MADRVSARFGWGLGAIALVMLLLPLLLNLLRGGASGVGRDPRTRGSDLVFAITYPATADPGPLSGTFYLIVAREKDPEPRRQLVSGGQEPFVFRRAAVALISSAAVFTPHPTAGSPTENAPMDLGSPPGGPERRLLLLFLDAAPRAAWERVRALAPAVDASGLARTRPLAPFLPTVVGTDTCTGELR